MLEQEKINLDYQVNWLKANTDKTYKERQMDVEEKRTEINLCSLETVIHIMIKLKMFNYGIQCRHSY